MKNRELKMTMRGRARLAKGLVNLLKDDIEQIYNSINMLDVIGLEEAINDIKRTTNQLIDTTTDLEYCLYIVKEDA